MKSTDDSLLGTMLGGHKVARLIGEGTMGSVYELIHHRDGARRTLKVLHADLVEDEAAAARFLGEAQALSEIAHPSIVEIVDQGQLPDGRPFLMMELVEGETLREHLRRRGSLTPAEAAAILVPVCSAIGAAHQLGIVHRNLTPENIRLVPGSGAKVLDFGIAKVAGDLGPGGRTRTGVILGTPRYMSPEQAAGRNREVDHRSDIYALGIITFEMLAGSPPFTKSAYYDILMEHLEAPVPQLGGLRPGIPVEWDEIVGRALAKKREDRYPSCAEMAADIERAPKPEVAAVRWQPPPPAVELPPAVSNPAIEAMPGPAGQATFQAATPAPAEISPAPGAAIAIAAHTPGHGAMPGEKWERTWAWSGAPPSTAGTRPPVGPATPDHGPQATVKLGPADAAAAAPEPSRPAGKAALAPPAPAALRPAVATPPRRPTSTGPAPTTRGARWLGPVLLGLAAVGLVAAAHYAYRARHAGQTTGRPEVDAALVIAVDVAASVDPVGAVDTERPAPIPAPTPPSASDPGEPARPAPERTERASRRPAPAASKEHGSLSIVVNPWARVEVDGVERGLTPVTLDLPAGRHRVVLTNPDRGKRESLGVSVRAGATSRIERAW